MKKATRIYLFIIVTAGLVTMLALFFSNIDVLKSIFTGVLFMSLLGAVAESQSVAIDETKAISIAVAINLSALLIFGLTAAVLVAFATALFSVMDYGRGHREHLFNTPLYKSLFNSSNYILSIAAAGYVYQALGGIYLLNVDETGFSNTLMLIAKHSFAIIGALAIYVFVNTLLVALYCIMEGNDDKEVLQDWVSIFRWSLLSMFAVGSIGVLLTAVYRSYGIIIVLLLFSPFMLLRYVYVGFSSIKKGYVDTINAFTSALEAKDDYTKGHSQRV